MTGKRINWFAWLRLAGIALFAVVLARTDLGEVWTWLKQVDGKWVAIAFLFQVLLLGFKAWRWFLLNEDDVSSKNLLQRIGEFLEAYAVGVITPGRAGELLKAGHTRGRANVISQGLLVIAERGFDLSIFFLVAGLVPLLGFLERVGAGTGASLLMVSLAGTVLSFALLIFPGVVRMVQRGLKFVMILREGQELVLIPRKKSTLAAFALLSVLSNISAFLSFYAIALAVSLNIGFFTVSGGVAFAGVINTIPVTIMGMGTRDVTLLFLFSDVARSQVLAFSGLVLLISQVGGGLLAMISGQWFIYRAKRW